METKGDKRSLLIRVVHFMESGLLVLILGAMIVLAFSQIAMRNMGGTGVIWFEPLLRHLVLWVALLGAMIASRTENHLAVDVITHFLPPRLCSLVRTITCLFTAAVCGFIVRSSILFMMDDYEYEMIAFANMPSWVMEIILPLGFGVIGLRYLFASLRHGLELLRAIRVSIRQKAGGEA